MAVLLATTPTVKVTDALVSDTFAVVSASVIVGAAKTLLLLGTKIMRDSTATNNIEHLKLFFIFDLIKTNKNTCDRF